MSFRNPAVGRRDWLRAAAGLATVAALPAMARPRQRRIGLQLYTLRTIFSADPIATLTRVRQIGYQEVEFAGLPAAPAKIVEIAEHLPRIGLAAPSMHIDLAAMNGSTDTLVRNARLLGARFIVLGYVQPAFRRTIADWRELAKFCNDFATRIAGEGLQFAYHNHDFEFAKLEGITPFDIFTAETDPARVQLELDIYWATKAGLDVAEMVRRYKNRISLCHIKDMAPDGTMTDVGSGTIDFGTLIPLLRKNGLQHAFVERDDAPAPYWPSVEASFAAASKL